MDELKNLISTNLKSVTINNKKSFPDFFLAMDTMIIGFYEDLEMIRVELNNKYIYYRFTKTDIIKIKSYLDN